MIHSERPSGPGRVGQVKEITSLANPIIKDIKSLSQKKHRDETRSFLVEGLKLVIDGVELGWKLQTLIYSKAAREKPQVQQIAARVVASGGLVLEVSEKVMGSIVRRDNPQMVCAIFEQQLTSLDDIHPQKDQTYIALDRVRDPGNLGTIIRTADAAGASGIILLGDTTDPFSLETVRATMGSIFALPIARAENREFMIWARANKVNVCATHLAGAVDYRRVDYSKSTTVLLMGNEQSGLPADLTKGADSLVRIPQSGRADSLNLAVATAVMLFEARRHLLSLDEQG